MAARKPTTRKTDDSAPTCATEGCGHEQNLHPRPGNTCWGQTDTGRNNCPCTHYATSKHELEVIENDQTPHVPTPSEPA